MSNINDAINEINKKHNFPSLNNLINLIQSKYPFSKNDIIKAVKSDVNTQIMQPRIKPNNKILGHITSLAPNERMEMDIFDKQRYKKNNIINKKIYSYMLVLIDVFSRFVYIEPLESKLQEPVLEAFKKLVHKVMSKQSPSKVLKEKTKSYAIHQLITDNEGSSQSNIVDKYLEDNNIILTMNAIHDHRVLGIIDNFAKRVKTILTKTFLINKSTRWLDIIDGIVDIYNKTSNAALDGLSPYQAMRPEHFNEVVKMNIDKMENNLEI